MDSLDLKIVKILLGKRKIRIITDKKREKNLTANVEKIRKLGWSPKQNINQIFPQLKKMTFQPCLKSIRKLISIIYLK